MSVSSSSKITNQAIHPVSKPANLAANLTPGFFSAFSAQAVRKEDEQKEGHQSASDKHEEPTDGNTTEAEIFKILDTYHFKDFFQLAMCRYGAQLKLIILKSRKARGVDASLPFSSAQNRNNGYINRARHQYLNANWLMEGKPGMSFTGTL